MEDEKKYQIQELEEELEVILSIKDDISKEEIQNFCSKFALLSELDIRNKIAEVTKNNVYIEELEESEIPKQEKVTEDHKEINQKLLPKEYEKINQKEVFKEDKEAVVVNDEKIFQNKEIENKEINKNDIDDISERNIPHNNDTHIIKKDKIINESDMPEITFVKAEIKYEQLSLEWGWKDEIEKVLICYRMDKFPIGPKDSSSTKIVVNRENSSTGVYTINKVIEGNYYFCIYYMVEQNAKNIFSKGQRRLVSNKEPSEIFYEIKTKKTIFGKLKNIKLELSTNEKEIYLPQMVLVGKMGNIPIQKSDGEIILNIDYESINNKNVIDFDISIDNLSKNMYVKLFFLDDSNSKLFRIISPSKENLHFK